MASNRDRDDPLSYTIPSSSSSPITVSDPLDSYLTDPNSHIGSASGSFQNEGLLADTGGSYNDAEFGFSRPEFRQNLLVGTVEYYERHVFLCYKNPKVWPPRIEAAEFDRLPRLLSAAVTARKGDMKKETRLTICEGHDGSETSNGDVLIFPDMVRYRRLTHFDVDTFVEEVLVKNGEWMPGMPETLKGSYIFVCSHGSRDRRCGVCGPALVFRFKEEIEARSLGGKVSVSPCSHIGGHKYAGNVIIFGSSMHGEVTGHWYGYVSPDDVSGLLEQHVGNGEILDQLWRGQMGLSEEQQRRVQELRLGMDGIAKVSSRKMLEENDGKEPINFTGRSHLENSACCQANGNATCCQTPVLAEENANRNTIEMAKTGRAEKKRSGQKFLSRLNSGKAKAASSPHKVCPMPAWYESWQREDTYAALAVICAAVSVGVACSLYKQIK